LLTTIGLVLAATDPNPAGTSDPLNLHGYAPRTATIGVSIDIDQTDYTGTLLINFSTNQLDLTMQAPQAAGAIELRWLKNRLFIRNPLASGSWQSLALTTPQFFGVGAELGHPEIDLLANAGHETITHANGATTYRFITQGAATQSGSTLSTRATETLSVTKGHGGEATALAACVRSAAHAECARFTVEAYNQPVVLHEPTASTSSPFSNLRSLLKGLQILIPTAWLGGTITKLA
jgi:hypothetical protein